MIFADSITSALQHPEAARLAELAQGKLVLEVGSEYGRSTIALASTAERVHAVDWHRGDQQSGFKDSLPVFIGNLNFYGVRDKVVIHIGKWSEVAPVLGPYRFDLIFIDGEHTEEAVRHDFQSAIRLLTAPGRIVFHDTDQPQVWAAVEAVAAYNRMPLARTVGTLAEAIGIHGLMDWREDEV